MNGTNLFFSSSLGTLKAYHHSDCCCGWICCFLVSHSRAEKRLCTRVIVLNKLDSWRAMSFSAHVLLMRGGVGGGVKGEGLQVVQTSKYPSIMSNLGVARMDFGTSYNFTLHVNITQAHRDKMRSTSSRELAKPRRRLPYSDSESNIASTYAGLRSSASGSAIDPLHQGDSLVTGRWRSDSNLKLPPIVPTGMAHHQHTMSDSLDNTEKNQRHSSSRKPDWGNDVLPGGFTRPESCQNSRRYSWSDSGEPFSWHSLQAVSAPPTHTVMTFSTPLLHMPATPLLRKACAKEQSHTATYQINYSLSMKSLR